jgi:hypothetical protein
VPDTLMRANVAEHFVKVTDAPGLTHDLRMEMQHHQPSGGSAIDVQTIEPVSP